MINTPEISKTFCILPWLHMYVNPDGSVLPCCIAQHNERLGNVQSESIEDIWNGKKYKNLRKRMLAGEKCKECTACYSSEDNNSQSLRQDKLKKFNKFISLANNTNQDGSLDSMDLKYFDVRWSNICNFKCRSCGSLYSSSWAAENVKHYDSQNEIFIFAGGKNNKELYEQFLPHFSNMEEIYFAGGEPLLTDKHYDILEHLISIGKTDVELRYNTNLSNLIYKNKNVIELWKQFSNVSIYASLDSWGTRAEYIREGTDWNLIEENLRLIRKHAPHVNLQTSSVVSVFNVSTMPEFLNYLIDTELFDKNNFFPIFYNLITPHRYSFQVLPDNFRKDLAKHLSSFDNNTYIKNEINGIINKLNNTVYNESLNQQFRIFNDRYDKIRNRNFIETFPELSSLYL